VSAGVTHHNERQGNYTGYHETITLVWISVIDRFLGSRDGNFSVSMLAAELLAECGDKDYLLQLYSRDRLFSDEARVHWVSPDRCEIL
jgi:hypothetical protein